MECAGYPINRYNVNRYNEMLDTIHDINTIDKSDDMICTSQKMLLYNEDLYNRRMMQHQFIDHNAFCPMRDSSTESDLLLSTNKYCNVDIQKTRGNNATGKNIPKSSEFLIRPSSINTYRNNIVCRPVSCTTDECCSHHQLFMNVTKAKVQM